jgi:hypothetical protein
MKYGVLTTCMIPSKGPLNSKEFHTHTDTHVCFYATVAVSTGLYACEVWMSRKGMARSLGQGGVVWLLDKQENERVRDRVIICELNKRTEELHIVGFITFRNGNWQL